MKKLYRLLFAALLLSLFLSSCASAREIKFDGLYNEVIGFADSEPTPEDQMLLLTLKDYKSFMDDYFTDRQLQIGEPNEDNAVLYIQIPAESTSVTPLFVKEIEAQGNKLVVKIGQAGKSISSTINVEPIQGFVGHFKWVIFTEVDKKYLRNNMEIEIVDIS
jgi:hypothetical protein